MKSKKKTKYFKNKNIYEDPSIKGQLVEIASNVFLKKNHRIGIATGRTYLIKKFDENNSYIVLYELLVGEQIEWINQQWLTQLTSSKQ